MASLATIETNTGYPNERLSDAEVMDELAFEIKDSVDSLADALGFSESEAQALEEFLVRGDLSLSVRAKHLRSALGKLAPAVTMLLETPLDADATEDQLTRSLIRDAILASRLDLQNGNKPPLNFLQTAQDIQRSFPGISLNAIYEAQAGAITELADAVTSKHPALQLVTEETIPEDVLLQMAKAPLDYIQKSRADRPSLEDEDSRVDMSEFNLLPDAVKEVALYVLNGGGVPSTANEQVIRKALSFLAGRKLDQESLERFQTLNTGDGLHPSELARIGASSRAISPLVVLPWADQARCLQADPDLFFPEKGGSIREAKRICTGCEAQSECLEYALANAERYGIWGGHSERERRRMK